MKAIEVIRPGEIHIINRENYGKPAADEVIIKMKAAGICGSDIHIYNGHSAFAVYPNIMGHELAGEIVEVGESVTHLQKGDKAVVNNVLSCGTCYACSIGRENVCREVKVLGVHVEGGYKEFLKIRGKNVYKIPNTVPWEHAALIEPYSIAAQVIDRGGLSENDHVLICGAGPLGLITLQAVKRLNVKVAAVDIVESRLEKAKELGADLVINTKKDPLVETVMDFTNQEGASFIVESTGNIAVLEICVSDLAAQAGRIVVLGFPKEKAKISPFDIMRRELDIIGSRLNNNKFPIAIEWMEKGEVDPEKIISHRYSFDQAKEAMDLINEKPNEVIKVVLLF
ncbi:zinc-binding alcohol dehydrogenase family protein [Paenibacillus sp. LHD-38]|uniref:zinc-binding alcohol dehydrogenase family protein n=1 Tax=Paenibacillus sp. LHD-38 TaxID=3072143 RepID=UPI00280EA1AE|nr:zinc-binding alcohol dehydrogenase family protein [Paenibacillus sp. LHD-38]MDQ8736198.1 zinc-binding alcohol dehydrogenase family protein [Paenibacillus sp. LHD-38]